MAIDYPYKDSNVSLIQRAVETGVAFRVYNRFTVPATGSVAFKAVLGDRNIALLDRIINSDQSNILYQVFAGATVLTNVGSPFTIRNMNQNSEVVSTSLVQQCTFSGGTESDLDILRGGGVGNNAFGTVFSTGIDHRVFSGNQTVVVKLSNPNVTAADVLVYLKWFEHKGGLEPSV